jgi:hypothetical protein
MCKYFLQARQEMVEGTCSRLYVFLHQGNNFMDRKCDMRKSREMRMMNGS